MGRHNALDKIIGTCLLRRQSIEACGVLLSSRLSFKMIVKAVRAGLELVAAVSAPTSLAIEIAERYGIMLAASYVTSAPPSIRTTRRVRDEPLALARPLARAEQAA